MKKIICLILVLMLCMSIVSCSTNDNKLDTVYASSKSKSVNSSNIIFAFDVFREINNYENTKNVFISPYSISSALSMLYNGAMNNTKTEMAKALGYSGISDKDFNNGQLYLRERLEVINKDVELDINNSIWIRQGFSVNPEFISLTKHVFDAYVTEINMDDDNAASTINKWIEKKTKGMIDKMIDPPIDSNVVMYLINTIYFNGKWQSPFDPNFTFDSTFYNNDDTTSNIDMMYQKNEFNYGKNDTEKIIEIPYGDGEVSMYCILPTEGTDINEYIANLDNNKWEQLRYSLLSNNTKEVTLMLPKFEIEYGIKNINQELQNLGMKDAFTDNADFGDIADNIFISRVLHKAVIEVDEVGTKAAAATVAEISLTSMPIKEPNIFEANRPFIYIISDKTDDSILFIGKMNDMK